MLTLGNISKRNILFKFQIIRRRNGRTLSIEIPPLVNNNGPVTAVHVVVMFIDTEISQQFDENLLKSYKQATEDGINYYITAELANEVIFQYFSLNQK